MAAVTPYVDGMRYVIATAIAACMTFSPVQAQTAPDAEDEDGFSLVEEGARMIMRGLMAEVEPSIDELRQTMEEIGPAFAEFAQSVGPAFAELLNQVDDLSNYAAPEFLPNGDIIMRRKPDAPLWEPDEQTGEIEL